MLPWVLGGLEDHVNMFLERKREDKDQEFEKTEEQHAKPVLETQSRLPGC